MEENKTIGARRLRDALQPRMRGSALAKELGVSQQAVNAWLQGIAKPRAEHMARIEELLGIPMRSWVEADADESGAHAAVTAEKTG